jgi:hypothetical protein
MIYIQCPLEEWIETSKIACDENEWHPPPTCRTSTHHIPISDSCPSSVGRLPVNSLSWSSRVSIEVKKHGERKVLLGRHNESKPPSCPLTQIRSSADLSRYVSSQRVFREHQHAYRCGNEQIVQSNANGIHAYASRVGLTKSFHAENLGRYRSRQTVSAYPNDHAYKNIC